MIIVFILYNIWEIHPTVTCKTKKQLLQRPTGSVQNVTKKWQQIVCFDTKKKETKKNKTTTDNKFQVITPQGKINFYFIDGGQMFAGRTLPPPNTCSVISFIVMKINPN